MAVGAQGGGDTLRIIAPPRYDVTSVLIAVESLRIMKAYIEAHRSDIEQDINDFGDLRPLLAILD